MKEAIREELLTQLQFLRPLLLNEPGRSCLDLFDEFLREQEFALALHVVCDLILQPNSPGVSKPTVDHIQRLHAAMEIDDRCVEELQKKLM